MSFLKRLFGGRTPAERVARGEQLLERGEPGLARVEFEAALASTELDEASRGQVRRRLDEVCDDLARARLADARSLLEAGDEDDALAALETAQSLVRDATLRAEIDALAGKPSTRPRLTLDTFVDESTGDDDPSSAHQGAEDDHESAATDEGADHLPPLELALLAFGESEADRLRALNAVDPAVGEALIAFHDGDPAAARQAFGRTREPATSDPIVQRELARSAIAEGEFGVAVPFLERLLAGAPEGADEWSRSIAPECLQLLMEAHHGAGESDAAADVAEQLLERNASRDLALMSSTLVDAGRAEVALSWVDRWLDKSGNDHELWQLRAELCATLADADGVAQADEKAFELYRAQCGSCGGSPTIPLASARRHAERTIAAEDVNDPASRERIDDLLRVMVVGDVEKRVRWQTLLDRLRAHT